MSRRSRRSRRFPYVAEMDDAQTAREVRFAADHSLQKPNRLLGAVEFCHDPTVAVVDMQIAHPASLPRTLTVRSSSRLRVDLQRRRLRVSASRESRGGDGPAAATTKRRRR